jgi:DNA modification methylase
MPEHEQMNLIPKEQTKEDPQLQAERESAKQRLAELLNDPEFRSLEGFPIGTNEAILAISDPPYYTACPNPFISEIIAKWQQDREEIREKLRLGDGEYQREPFAADVSEGKTDPIYNAHSYHTKVPHKAIMRYILHYTDPGDIVFDGFCGTGMTGVAAQLCANKDAVQDLGYLVDDEGIIWDVDKQTSRLGLRNTILNDLSPVATFIAHNYNASIDTTVFEREAKRVLKMVKEECGWMYETYHTDEKTKGLINYVVWSEVLACPNCSSEINFYQEAFDESIGHVKEQFSCPHCGINVSKSDLELLFDTRIDRSTGSTIKQPRRIPVLINYRVGKGRYEKNPDSNDLEILKRIEALSYPEDLPELKLPDMQMARVGRMKTVGVIFIRDFFLSRQIHALASLWRHAKQNKNSRVRNFSLFLVEQAVWGMSVLNRYQPIQHGRLGGSQVNRALSGVFYVASQISEVSPWYNLDGKLARLVKAFSKLNPQDTASILTTEDLGSMKNLANSIDYVFTDPPFGENIYYSDLNILIEAWHGVLTAPATEAIVDRVKGKNLRDYQNRMESCFKTYFEALKPGRWITVEFHNSKNIVWNAIQEALQRTGFVIADVRVLDKQQKTFQQANTTSAVKQDLIISAYKPNGNLESKFLLVAGSEEGAWEFVRYHLSKLPSVNTVDGKMVVNAERQAFLLFDRMVAFHIQRGVMVPISSPEFYAGLEQRFTRRDGMYFLPDQVAEYDRALLNSNGVVQLQMFVTDEKSAIAWLRQELDPSTNGGPQTQADLNPKFKLVLHQAKHEQSPELIEILEQNFLQDEHGRWYVPDPNKASDLEKVRQRSLLREFKEYLEGRGRLRLFRTEAVRAGFLEALRKQEYDTIIKVAERLPEDILREDPDMLMYYDSAMLRKK